MRQRQRHVGESSQASEALADIALNSFGLILIVLLVYIIGFRQAANADATARDPNSDRQLVERQIEQNRELKRKVKELEKKVLAKAGEEAATGLWRFRIHVNRLVDHNDRTEPADFVVDYFVWLQITDGSVRGSLFGVREHGEAPLGSSSHGNITGSYRAPRLRLEIAFTGSAAGGSEILSVERRGDQFIGELMSGRHKTGYRNYVGPARGTRLTSSVFSQ